MKEFKSFVNVTLGRSYLVGLPRLNSNVIVQVKIFRDSRRPTKRSWYRQTPRTFPLLNVGGYVTTILGPGRMRPGSIRSRPGPAPSPDRTGARNSTLQRPAHLRPSVSNTTLGRGWRGEMTLDYSSVIFIGSQRHTLIWNQICESPIPVLLYTILYNIIIQSPAFQSARHGMAYSRQTQFCNFHHANE